MEKSTVSNQNRFPLWKPLTVPNFLLLFIGQSVSLSGDQLYLVALPWLTIQLTNSGVSLGTVLMAAAIPRAVLMLFGGVVSDRLSSRLVMIIANTFSTLLTIFLAVVVAFKATQLWHLYLFAIGFGIVDGFFIPATRSIVPSLVSEELLTTSNILLQSTSQLILLIGPALGGLLIATAGIETAFAIDAASFIFAIATLLLIKDSRKANAVATKTASIGKSNETVDSSIQKPTLTSKIRSLISGIGEGLNYGWHNFALRAILLILTMLNFLFLGPLQVGITSLAHNRFPGGAVALGIMNSAWGGGGLLGTLMPQIFYRLPRIGVLMLSLASIQGLGLFLLSFAPNIILASITIAVLGCCSGFFTVVAITWIQKQTPPQLLGRVMSLGMLSSYGIAPFSYALAGLLADLNLTFLFGTAGGIMLIITILLSANPSLRRID
jgi:MFS family permease